MFDSRHLRIRHIQTFISYKTLRTLVKKTKLAGRLVNTDYLRRRFQFVWPLLAVCNGFHRFYHKIDETVNVLELFRVKFRSDRGTAFEFRYHRERTFRVRVHLYLIRQFQFQLLVHSRPLDQESTLLQWDG